MKTIGFIGGGRVVRIFLQAWKNANFAPEQVTVYETNTDVAKALKNSFEHVDIASDLKSAASAEVVVIALHPPAIKEHLQTIAEAVSPDTIVVSLAPKVDIPKMQAVLPGKKVVRIIPNATSFINKGFNPLSFAPDLSTAEKDEVLRFMQPLGQAVEVHESELEGYAIISAMLPTYFWTQWKTMLQLAGEMNIKEDAARKSVRDTLHAAIDLMFDSNLDYEEMSDLIPVKPLAKVETEINEKIKEQLMGLYQKIKP